jgi:hypothetical protein
MGLGKPQAVVLEHVCIPRFGLKDAHDTSRGGG